MKQIVTFFILSSICLLSSIKCSERQEKESANERPSNYQRRAPLHPNWVRNPFEAPEEASIPYYKLKDRTLPNNKPLVVSGLPMSQQCRNITVTANITFECERARDGKKVQIPQPHIEQVGRYRDYSHVYTYDFRKMTEPVTCTLTVESSDSIVGWKAAKEIGHNKEVITFYVVPAKKK